MRNKTEPSESCLLLTIGYSAMACGMRKARIRAPRMHAQDIHAYATLTRGTDGGLPEINRNCNGPVTRCEIYSKWYNRLVSWWTGVWRCRFRNSQAHLDSPTPQPHLTSPHHTTPLTRLDEIIYDPLCNQPLRPDGIWFQKSEGPNLRHAVTFLKLAKRDEMCCKNKSYVLFLYLSYLSKILSPRYFPWKIKVKNGKSIILRIDRIQSEIFVKSVRCYGAPKSMPI